MTPIEVLITVLIIFPFTAVKVSLIDFCGFTFTLSNVQELGIELGSPVIILN